VAKINDWLEEDKLILLEGWARDGLTNEQIANNIGINVKTLYDWKNKNSNICNVLKKGKEVADYEVENALYKRAVGYRYDEITYENGVETKRITKEVAPDTLAQIYWLKNRKPNNWKDKVVDSENEEAIINAKDILVKIRKTADDRYERD